MIKSRYLNAFELFTNTLKLANRTDCRKKLEEKVIKICGQNFNKHRIYGTGN